MDTGVFQLKIHLAGVISWEGELTLLREVELSVVLCWLELCINLTEGLLCTAHLTNGDQRILIETNVFERLSMVSVQASLADNRLQSTLAGPKFNSRATNSNHQRSAADQKGIIYLFLGFSNLVCGHSVVLRVEIWGSYQACPNRRTPTQYEDAHLLF